MRPGIIGKVQKSLDVFLSFLLTGFCDLLQKHKVVSRIFYDRGIAIDNLWPALPFSLFVLKEAALSGGSYLGCLQSVNKKTEAPFGLAFSCSLSMAIGSL